MSAYPTAVPVSTNPTVRTMTWMCVAGLATLATLAMATLAVTERLAAAVLLLIVGAGVLVVLPLLYKTRRYAEALLEAEATLHDHEQLGVLRVDARVPNYPTVNVGGNLTVLRDPAVPPVPTVAPETRPTAEPAVESAAPGGTAVPLLMEQEPPEDDLADSGREVSADGNILIAPDGRADAWSGTVARITYLQEPIRSSRRGSAARPR